MLILIMCFCFKFFFLNIKKIINFFNFFIIINYMLKINEIAPNFTAITTNGKIDFHEWIGDSWVILFFTP